MSLRSYCLGNLIVLLMGVHCSAALKVYPSFQHYNHTTEFTSLICTDDYGGSVSSNDVEWLSPNFNILLPSPDYRIYVFGDFVTFTPPLYSDAGSYWCRNRTNHSDIAEAMLIFIGSPELISDQNQTVTVNIDEAVILNCTVSASPDPVYSWSFPDSCSSCPNTSNDNVLIFTAEDVTDTGEYTCIAENEYGNISMIFDVIVATKPIMITKFATIHKDQSTSNVMLTCAVRYAYPTAEITWNFITKSSRIYHVVEENSTGNYILHKNGSLEVYRHFIYEEDHVNVMCSASNKFGSAQTVFSIWDDEQFSPEETFELHVRGQSCEEFLNRSEELFQVLREWSNSVCNCDDL